MFPQSAWARPCLAVAVVAVSSQPGIRGPQFSSHSGNRGFPKWPEPGGDSDFAKKDFFMNICAGSQGGVEEGREEVGRRVPQVRGGRPLRQVHIILELF